MGAELPSRWGGCRDTGQLHRSLRFCSEQVEYFELKHYRNCSNLVPYKPQNEHCDYNTTMDVT